MGDMRFKNKTAITYKWLYSLVLLVLIPTQALSEQQNHKIAVVVNSEIISDYDIKSRIRFLLYTSGLEAKVAQDVRFRSLILNRLIQEKLKLQEMKRNQILVKGESIQATIRRMEKTNNLASGQLIKNLMENGIDPNTFERSLEASIGWNELIRRKLAILGDIDDKAIDEQIKLINKNKGKPEYLVSEIFIPVTRNQSDTNASKIVDRIYQQAKKGSQFEQLAKSFSQSPSSKKGGNVGWIREDQIDQNLSKALSRSRKGEILPPTQVTGGYYIIKVRNRRVAAGITSDNARIWLYQILFPHKDGAPPLEVKSQLGMAESVAEIAKDCKDLELIGKEIGTVVSGNIDDVKLADLTPLVRREVKNLKIGKVGGPLRTEAGILIIMVCRKEVENKIAEIRSKVRQKLAVKKMTSISRRILIDLRRSSFIEIRK